jgi:anti-sigma regulatory factor (Ser/Thr protein kinase)
MDDDRAVLRLDLPGRPEASGAARKALAALNGSLHLVSEERLRDAQLLVSELVANAVRYGGRPADGVTVVVQASPDAMRIEVIDQGGGFDPAHLLAPSTERAGGWGLPIVAALAHRWGVERGATTTVWFDIDRPQRDVPLVPEPTPPETRSDRKAG